MKMKDRASLIQLRKSGFSKINVCLFLNTNFLHNKTETRKPGRSSSAASWLAEAQQLPTNHIVVTRRQFDPVFRPSVRLPGLFDNF